MASHEQNSGNLHEKIETNNFLLIVLTLITISFGGLAEIVPLFFQKTLTEPIRGLRW